MVAKEKSNVQDEIVLIKREVSSKVDSLGIVANVSGGIHDEKERDVRLEVVEYEERRGRYAGQSWGCNESNQPFRRVDRSIECSAYYMT